MKNELIAEALAALAEAHPEVVAQHREVPKDSAWSSAPPTDTTELHQKLAEELSPTAAALVECEAAQTNWDDERRWDRLAGALTAVVMEWPKLGFDILDAVGPGHDAIDQAVVRGWAISQPGSELVPQILDRICELTLDPILGSVTAMLGGYGFSGSTPVEWFRFAESEALAKECWNRIALTAPDSSYVNGYAMMATNHPAGNLTEFWIERIGHLWNSAPETWKGIPPEIADYLAELIADDYQRNEAVEIILCRYLHFLYRADAEWSKLYLIPLFNWDNEPRATRAWSGFLSHGGWTAKLLEDGFLTMLVSTVDHRDQLDKPGQRNLSQLLAAIAVATDTDPRSWIRDLITKGTVEDRVAWAKAIRFQLDSLGTDAVETQWVRWIRDYMTDRVKSVPRILDPAEASVMANWVLFLGDSMSDAIDLLLQTETEGLKLHDLFLHDLGQEQIDRAPDKIAQLVQHLLKSTTGQFFGGHEIMRTYDQLTSAGVSVETLRQIAETALGLGISLE
jgi:Domain of unknown function (DUF4020)